jgi:hypothetical protein
LRLIATVTFTYSTWIVSAIYPLDHIYQVPEKLQRGHTLLSKEFVRVWWCADTKTSTTITSTADSEACTTITCTANSETCTTITTTANSETCTYSEATSADTKPWPVQARMASVLYCPMLPWTQLQIEPVPMIHGPVWPEQASGSSRQIRCR